MGNAAHNLGLNEVAQEFKGDEELRNRGADSSAVFDAQQTILTNIMVVSALLLGFIVTGTMLSISLTGKENFGILELIQFFSWSGMAAMFSFVSLTTSFLTSVWGSNFMTMHGPEEAARAITSGSVLRHVVAEGSLYMSMFFFLISLNCYVHMVYSGPDICPSYRGTASFCARHGLDLYMAAESVCGGQCTSYGGVKCESSTNRRTCLCTEYCKTLWTDSFNWSTSAVAQPKGVDITYAVWFAYWSPLTVNKPRREKIITEAASVMCNHEELESAKENCFKLADVDCSTSFLAWERSEECMESAVQDSEKCTKVCAWSSDGLPPREALNRATTYAFVPLGCALVLLTLGRSVTLVVRGCKAFRERQEHIKNHLAAGPDGSSDESSTASERLRQSRSSSRLSFQRFSVSLGL
mmetsp:Transcript_77569/g.179835  ORF Transcript_77569/g.179835 Transcript_77569/m.179835 type:complete len:411 (-) Transcript_77569:124-1356(-)